MKDHLKAAQTLLSELTLDVISTTWWRKIAEGVLRWFGSCFED
jgi:hypothetical protein